jgi:tetratricopeptide (TPR) repeat protein
MTIRGSGRTGVFVNDQTWYGYRMKLVIIAALSVGFGFGQGNDCDSLDACQKILQVNPRESLAHYRIGEILFQEKNYQGAANEFRQALNGNLDPRWIEVWSRINLGKIFDISGQRDRAVNEYVQAQRTRDNTRGALGEVARYLKAPYTSSQEPTS